MGGQFSAKPAIAPGTSRPSSSRWLRVGRRPMDLLECVALAEHEDPLILVEIVDMCVAHRFLLSIILSPHVAGQSGVGGTTHSGVPRYSGSDTACCTRSSASANA